MLDALAHRFAIWDSKAESFTQSLVSAGTWVAPRRPSRISLFCRRTLCSPQGMPVLTKLVASVASQPTHETVGGKALTLAKKSIVEDCGLYGNDVRPQRLAKPQLKNRGLVAISRFPRSSSRDLTRRFAQCAADQFYAN